MTTFDVATVGDNCIDRYAAPVGLSFVGGNAVNVAVKLAARRPGVAYFGAVGDDAAGRRVIAALRERNVDVEHLRVSSGITAYTNIEFDAAGERVFAFEEFGVCRGYRPSDANLELLKRLRHVHLGWLDDGGILKRTLLAAGVGVSQDLSVNAAAVDARPDGLSVAFMSSDSRDRAEVQLEKALAAGAKVSVVTLGRLGSLASDGTTTVEADALSVAAVDTTGAGDTFIAAFIAAQLSGHDLRTSLDAGRTDAASTCLHYGGFPQSGEPL